MKRINIDFKVEKNGKLVKVQSEESVPTKTSELENDSGFITQAPETVIDNQTITKNSTNELQTIGVKYNDNLITAEMIYNATHYIRYKEDEPTPPTPTGETGLYVNGVLSKSWAQLIADGDVTITNGALHANTNLHGDLVCDNVEGLTNLNQAFFDCSRLTSIDTSKLDTSNVNDMYGMFYNCSSLPSLDVSKLDTSNVTDMTGMFNSCSNLSRLDLSHFNTTNVTDMLGMFGLCSYLMSLNLSSFNTTNVTDMTYMFGGCSSLTNLDISSFTFDKVTTYDSMFDDVPNNCEILVKSQTEKDWITSKFTNLTNVKIKGTPPKEAGLYVNGVLSKSWAQLIADGDVITHMEDTHADVLMAANTSLQGDLVCDNAEGATYLALGFEDCTALTSIDFSKVDTSNVEYMLFSRCSSLTSLDLSGFSTTKVTDMASMFDSCSGLTSLDLSGFNTSEVIAMSFMFSHCSSLTSLDVSNFNTSKVTNMNGMFSHCSSLTSLDLSSFDTTNVTDIRQMFSGCSGLTSLDLSGFSTTNVTDMTYMFNNCSSLTSLDISNFTFDKVTGYTDMFTDVPNNCEILVKSQTEKDWITSKFTNLTNVKIKGTV